jgi:hypothetical protein
MGPSRLLRLLIAAFMLSCAVELASAARLEQQQQVVKLPGGWRRSYQEAQYLLLRCFQATHISQQPAFGPP